jgi:hypothetical protein
MEGQTVGRLDIITEGDVRECILDVLQRALDITVRSANVFLDVRLSLITNRTGEERRSRSIARNGQPLAKLTIKGAFGIPLGLFS